MVVRAYGLRQLFEEKREKVWGFLETPWGSLLILGGSRLEWPLTSSVVEAGSTGGEPGGRRGGCGVVNLVPWGVGGACLVATS